MDIFLPERPNITFKLYNHVKVCEFLQYMIEKSFLFHIHLLYIFIISFWEVIWCLTWSF